MAIEDTISLLAATPATVYREYVYRPHSQLARWVDDRFDVVARPGQRIGGSPREGDLLLEVTLGRIGYGRCTTLSGRDLDRLASRPRLAHGQLLLRARGRLEMSEPLPVEPSTRREGPDALGENGATQPWSGAYDAKKIRPPDFSDIVDAEDVEGLPWTDSSDERAFRDRVLEAHLSRSRKRRGAPQRDLEPDELELVPGADVKTARATARAAGQLLAAANANLKTAQVSGNPDAQHTLRLTVNSGYRSNQEQRALWLGYFSAEDGYYNRSRAARGKLADGPHSEQALTYLLTPLRDGGFGLGGRIAAPGYSNHQGGIAVDLHQQRVRGFPVRNKSDKESRARWRATWFHHWLRDNAADYGFHPIDTEEWHWEYRPGQVSASRPPTGSGSIGAASPASGIVQPNPGESEYLGGKLWTFTAMTLPLPVAVFCPKAALSHSEVEILLYVHGLLNPRRQRPHVPTEFVTDPPFALGHIIHASGRPMVLVVPLLDWDNPGGEHVFGRGHGRWQALAAPHHINGLINEVLIQLGRVQAISAPAAHELIIAGHSRAYDLLEPLVYSRGDPAMHEGALANLSRVWAFDTTYVGHVDRWVDWLKLDPQLQVQVFYRPGSEAHPSGTANVGLDFYRHRGPRLVVTPVSEDHSHVPAMRLPALLNPPVHALGGEADEFEAAGDAQALFEDIEPGDQRLNPSDSSAVGDLAPPALAEFGSDSETPTADGDRWVSATRPAGGAGQESEDAAPLEDRFVAASTSIRALRSRTGSNVHRVLARLTFLGPVEMCRLGEDPDLVGAITDHLAGAELAEAGAQLARGRVSAMGRADLGRIIATPSAHTLGPLAGACGREVLLEHQEAYDRSGTGTIHGNRSGVPKPPAAVSTDCTEYVLAVLAQAFTSKGLAAEWQAVRRIAASDSGSRGLKGTEVIKALQAHRNWQALFWSPDPTDPADGTSEHPFAYRIARTSHLYYGIPVDPTRSVINYRRTRPHHPVDTTGIERLHRLQFGLLAARGGIHMAMIVNGDVLEVHWDVPATSRDAITATPLEAFGWQSGVIAAPPGDLELAWRMP